MSFQQVCYVFCQGFVLGALTFTFAAKPAVAANLVVNGSFEEIVLPNPSWTVFPWSYGNPLPHGYSSIPGWNVPQGYQFELQRNVAGTAAQGSQLLELDASTTQKGSIYQDIITNPGQNYLLKFAFSPRPGLSELDNILQVKWGGSIVDTISASGIGLLDTTWKYFTYNLNATSNTMRLEFFDLGTPTHAGTYIDDVSVQSVETIPEFSSALSLLAFGAFGVGSLLKRKQQQKALDSVATD